MKAKEIFMVIDIKPITIVDKNYYSVQQMASLTNKKDQTVYALIKRGNAVRKMKSLKVLDRILIPCSELTEFPFTHMGVDAKNNTYHYDKKGKIVESEN